MNEACNDLGKEAVYVAIGDRIFSSKNPEPAEAYARVVVACYPFIDPEGAYFALLTVAYKLKDILGPELMRELFKERLLELRPRSG